MIIGLELPKVRPTSLWLRRSPLEELATNYEQKENDLTARAKEFEDAQEIVQNAKNELMEKESEIQQHKENLIQMRKKHVEMLTSLTREFADLSDALNEHGLMKRATQVAEKVAATAGAHVDEDFTKLRLNITKMKTEARVVGNRVKELEEERTNQTQSLRKTEEEARDLRVKVQECELRITHLNEKVEESEARKRNLQDSIDQMNSELAVLKANEQVLGGSKQNEILASQREIQVKLDEEMKRQNSAHQQQVKELRDNVADYERRLEEQKDRIAHLEFQHQSIVDERNKLQGQHDETVKKLEKLELMEEHRIQAQKDLESLQQTVNNELEVLHNQRKLWMQQMLDRLNKSKKFTARKKEEGVEATAAETEAALAVDDEEENGVSALFGGNMIQQAKIAYLENNFSKLNKVHKQLLQNRHEMRNELVRMEKRHKMAVERITILETSLKEAKEGAVRDRKRYNHEIERIREAMRQKSAGRRAQAPQIVKGIRGGHGGPAVPVVCGGGAQYVSSSQP
ncbi:hypothetical protein Ciccas_006529 [Cichlidogyrus casuarinus]|uniref:Uncharacterized protein n=1 Tax=Cichlidogyrus casuarinus TaxID=1844966 RepID=A0ABD2Q5H4_9PLAT